MNPGDVVRLKSGGPLMTLASWVATRIPRSPWSDSGTAGPTPQCACVWIELSAGICIVRRDVFPTCGLEKVVQ